MKPLILAGIVCCFASINHTAQTIAGELKIAASQFPVSANIDSNAIWIRQHMREAAEAGCDVIHFPECALAGYAGVDHETLNGFDWHSLRAQTQTILELAKELNLWVILGSAHPLSDGYKPHNCLYVINTKGEIIDRYDKRFCTSGDLDHYTPGDHFVQFSINGVRCGLLICYDVRFPELYRAYRKNEVQVVFQSFYNARQKPGSIHPTIMPITAQARAATNGFYMSLTNSSAKHSWPCHFITPDGLINGKLDSDVPSLLISKINTNDKFYDASRRYRMDAMSGKLNSGQVIEDERSSNRTSY
ncbi:MAG: carbon-nitrogen hydrolase family protein [Saprospiraceae bacterium]|nr:carbon-nitrogen hydrolase family protein [Saprospiraceae bacterium]